MVRMRGVVPVKNKRRERSQRYRVAAFAAFDKIPVGARIEVAHISAQLKTGKRDVMPKSVANFLKERDDFRPCGSGTWERIGTQTAEAGERARV